MQFRSTAFLRSEALQSCEDVSGVSTEPAAQVQEPYQAVLDDWRKDKDSYD